MTATDVLPDDIPQLKALIAGQRAAMAAQQAEIAHLKLWIAKLRRQQYGQRSERADHLLNQIELQLEDLESGETERAVRLESAAPPPAEPKTRALPAHLPRDVHIHHPEVTVCPDCGGPLKPLGEDHSELLEYVPSHFRAIRHVRPKQACARCDRIVQRRPRSARLHGDWPDRACWRMCWSRSTRITCRCTGNPRFMPAPGSSYRARPWRIGSARQRRCCGPWLPPCAGTS